ncbi:DUF2163 domain-containing protein [Maribius pontilimi]|uniref:DUF2163 domain-containing protein n=1 Tax=Palleronia pontilimi TaxID=1964209 RepID=A0A934I7M1_9RHOB|nr:DUF2163 domain-containing protein [Palleronia pontilimi]MBJ3761934.1 DUF2163 domain-containing protein [Palleronia pontilimi]
MQIPAPLLQHLETGVTTLCRCWRVTRRDGRVYGFTDHDLGVTFDGTSFRADDGLSARTLEQSTGLSVDNSEALGVLSAAGVTEGDILAGRFDGAKVESWLVNWSDPAQRTLLFTGEMGEIQRAGGAFKAELRGLTEALNQPQGRTYQEPCAAVLGDESCQVDLGLPQFFVERDIVDVVGGRIFDLGDLSDFDARWFERGRLVVLTGNCAGDVRIIKSDELTGADRRIALWDTVRGTIAPGDRVRIEAGCDKRVETCRMKFANILNFQGFPHLPGEDFLMAYPIKGQEGSK